MTKRAKPEPPSPKTPEQSVENHLRFRAAELANEAEAIAQRLTYLALHLRKRLEADDLLNLQVNSLGELQGSGPVFDAKCASVATLRDVLRQMRGQGLPGE